MFRTQSLIAIICVTSYNRVFKLHSLFENNFILIADQHFHKLIHVVTGEKMGYLPWLSIPWKSMVMIAESPVMTPAVYHGDMKERIKQTEWFELVLYVHGK